DPIFLFIFPSDAESVKREFCTCAILKVQELYGNQENVMLKPGDNIDSWCGKCKMMLAHTIEAVVRNKPARLHCNTCQAQHSYKPYEPGEAPSQVREREAAGRAPAPTPTKGRGNRYLTLLRG